MKLTFAANTFAAWTFNAGHWTGVGDGIVTTRAVPGIEYRAFDQRPHYTAGDRRPHYRSPDQRPHYSSRGTD